jgi:hypothetical protein
MVNDYNKIHLAVVPQDFIQKLESDMQELKAILRVKNEHDINSQWIESVKIPEILGISRKTWQTYRDKRLLPFVQIGSKIYVKRADLEDFMNGHLITTQP